jgi:acyl-CoA thioesterase
MAADDADEPVKPEREAHLAHAVGARMIEHDHASKALGMTLEEIGPGRARMRMPVRHDMLNGHGTCHGGFIFSLADSTFAFACNSRNLVTVAAGCSIEFLRPAYEGDVLNATGVEVALAGRTGIYDILVKNQNDEPVAAFRGKSARIKGQIIDTKE